MLDIYFLLELCTCVPLMIAVKTYYFSFTRFQIFIPSYVKLYVPIFLNCWLANGILQEILLELNRVSQASYSALHRHMIELFSLLICLIFTGTCGIQHLQRAGEKQFDLFTSFYFVIVTFSTVGKANPLHYLAQVMAIATLTLGCLDCMLSS